MEPRHTPSLPTRVVTLGAVLLLHMISPPVLGAQTLEQAIRALSEENAARYAHPVVSGVGAGMNSAWSHTARVRGLGELFVGVRAMAAFIPPGDDVYAPALPASVTVPELGGRSYTDPYGATEGRVTPTVAGAGRGLVIEPAGSLRHDLEGAGYDPADFAVVFPDGFDLPAIPLVMGQLAMGLPARTELSLRFIPYLELDRTVGTVSAIGVGGKHSLSQWLSESFPVDVALVGGAQWFRVGAYVSASSRTLGLVVSRRLGALSLFGGAAGETSDVEVGYTTAEPVFGEPEVDVRFREEGDNRERLTLGSSLDLSPFQLSADYTFSTYDVLSVTLGFGTF